jgi:hypothetical protein
MRSRTWGLSTLAAAVAAVVGISAVVAQEARQAATQAETQEVEGQAYRAKSVLGSKVSIENNTSIGTVDDIVFTDDGYLEYLIVLNENKLVTVPWEAAKFNFEKRTAVVNITPERFKAIPTYTVDRYPVFSAPQYRVETYRFYGLTPGQQRRAIRRARDND